MRTTIDLHDQLLIEAHRTTVMKARMTLIHEGLKVLIDPESARRLARLGATEPRLQPCHGAVRGPYDPDRYLPLGCSSALCATAPRRLGARRCTDASVRAGIIGLR